jgi:tetratricopeptide (TPR) repeat protein
MKKKLVLFFLLATVALGANAQKFKISSAEISLREGNLELAKQDIDEAALSSSTSNSPYMYKVRGDVYYAIARDTLYAHLDPEAAKVSMNSFIACMNADKLEKRQKYLPDALAAIPEAGVMVYLKAYAYYSDKNYAKSLEFWQVLLDGFNADTTERIAKRLQVAKNDVVQNCANMAIKMEDKATAQKYLNMMINDPKYLSPNAYLQMSFMMMEAGDTTKALEIIDKGRKKIPDNKDLFNQELGIYTALGKTNLMIKKLSEVIENEPNNTLYLYYRGTLLSDQAYKTMESGYRYSDSASAVRKKSKSAKTPADKKKYQAEMDMWIATRDSIYAVSAEKFDGADKDFSEALLLDPTYYDALYNLGVLYFNKNKILVDKYNYLEYSEAQTKGKELEAAMKVEYEKALEILLKAYEIKPDDSELLRAIQQTYSQLGNKEKSEEFRKLRSGE